MSLILGPAPSRRDTLVRRIRLLVALTIAYNVVEAVVALSAGFAASSTALIGFGLDSVVEVSSATAVAWQFAARDHASQERRERVALRVIAASFVGLALIVGYHAIEALVTGAEADESRTGIVLAAVSTMLMPFLSFAQRRAGRELGSSSAVSDSHQTLLCTYLSGALLLGLLLNAAWGITWADPVVALAIAAVALVEARRAWRGDACCAPAMPGSAAAATGDCGDGCCSPGAVT
ncbi:MAG: cation transporter [Aeromicrobium sp.]|nr:cation transporter [Aeromicrobium sp.]